MAWVDTPLGRRWGAHGAAGLLLVHDDHYLLTLRSALVHMPDVWSLPGGALERGESAEQAAARECREELGDVPTYRVVHTHVAPAGRWAYTTVVATTDLRWHPPRLSWETAAVRWVPRDEVSRLPLHPGLAAAWPSLRAAAS